MMTREQIIFAHPIRRVMEARGHAFKQAGKESVCICPFHKDGSPSFRVNTEKGTWFCDPCGFGGSVIDLVMKLDGIGVKEAMEKLGGEVAVSKPINSPPIATYEYQDANGKMLYQALRYEPKTFRQRRPDGEGKWIWNMERVNRVLYRLPEVMEAEMVCVVEGEKDADNLTELGMVSTCNIAGAGKWLDAYALSLAGKDVILCPDNDEPGKKHMETVAASLAGKVKSLRHVIVPAPHKDVSDFIESFVDKDQASKAWLELVSKARKIHGGVDLPIHSMEELEVQYRELMETSRESMLDLSCWLPSLKNRLRVLMPGEVVAIVADTSAGKTAILQNIAISCHPLPTLLFEMELPGPLTFERFASLQTKKSGSHIEKMYMAKEKLDWRTDNRLSHIFTCSLSKMTPEILEDLIVKSQLKIGKKPVVVMVDYLQIMRGGGKNRYEKTSEACEDFKAIAKATGTVLIFCSQRSRNKEEGTGEIFLHDGKDSGSIESSAGVLLGAWRDAADDSKMFVKVCKQTKGIRNFTIPCKFHGETMTIREEI